ncbi:MAG: dephospho-CoA kinase, partial [Chloroflexi bacterium]|nr:dephospho-CoA kinase [Chloroflexota bacterium]
TVAKLLEDKGAALINADLLGHEVYLPGKPAYDDIIEAFGRDVVAEDGTIDRKKLGPIVFSDPANLARLNEITHPRIADLARERLAELEASGQKIAVLEAAILFEAHWESLVDEIWVTVVDPSVAAQRTAERSGLDPKQVMERINAQMTDEERISRADFVVSTEGALSDTAERTDAAWQALHERLNNAS